jgi:hypothetical protein
MIEGNVMVPMPAVLLAEAVVLGGYVAGAGQHVAALGRDAVRGGRCSG